MVSLVIFLLRYLHYLMLIYFAFYLLFFKETGLDAVLYLIFAIVLCSSWPLFDCCILSYYELRLSGYNHHDYSTSYHPSLVAIFGDYHSIFLTMFGVLMFFTFFYLLYFIKKIKKIYKVFIGSIFFALYAYNVITTRIYENKLYYPTDKNHILNRIPPPSPVFSS